MLAVERATPIVQEAAHQATVELSAALDQLHRTNETFLEVGPVTIVELLLTKPIRSIRRVLISRRFAFGTPLKRIAIHSQE